MIDLVRKRHEGDGWIVFEELGDRTGYYAKRHADAAALGVWSSKGYELHGYEFKASRGDLKKELNDPTKYQGVGKHCHYWWLVLEDEKLMDGLAIPDIWGIIVPTVRGGQRLPKVLRKAPKQKPALFDPLFAVSMIRNIRGKYIAPGDQRALKRALENLAEPVDPVKLQESFDKDAKIASLSRELETIKSAVSQFEAASGIEMGHPFHYKRIGEAVKIAMRWQNLVGEEPGMGLRTEINRLSQMASQLEDRARELASAAIHLRDLEPLEHRPGCAGGVSPGLHCRCGVKPHSDIEAKLMAERALEKRDLEASARADRELECVSENAARG